ncbi:MAG: cytochrome c3 family protein [Bacteroidales bacterium]|nr:cytochrome c3 family protein [Bacteroidales bacterium]
MCQLPSNGYAGTSSECSSCHINDYNQSANPSHTSLSLSNDCASCHTTAPGWAPATFSVHNNYYALQGAHVAIASQCADCHNGNYNSTPNTCDGCHIDNYNQTTNPNHVASHPQQL